MKQLPLPIAPPPADSFDALVVGPNAQAVQHFGQTAFHARAFSRRHNDHIHCSRCGLRVVRLNN